MQVVGLKTTTAKVFCLHSESIALPPNSSLRARFRVTPSGHLDFVARAVPTRRHLPEQDGDAAPEVRVCTFRIYEWRKRKKLRSRGRGKERGSSRETNIVREIKEGPRRP
ncbi:hypothetical protein MRX96_056541 [Rhipicephalus microplus]